MVWLRSCIRGKLRMARGRDGEAGKPADKINFHIATVFTFLLFHSNIEVRYWEIKISGNQLLGCGWGGSCKGKRHSSF